MTNDKRRHDLVSEANYHSTKWFTDKLLGIKIRKTKITISKPIDLGLTILGLSNIEMYEFWYDYIKKKI